MNPGIRAPRWRAVLEARWRARLQEVTELSLAYHAAAAAGPPDPAAAAGPADPPGPAGPQPSAGGPGPLGTQRLLRHEMLCRELLCRAIVARRKLADVEEALGRLATGTFGYCEQCESPIPAGLLAAVPERRYCPRCEAGADPAPTLSGQVRA
jgi:hypothetical protein